MARSAQASSRAGAVLAVCLAALGACADPSDPGGDLLAASDAMFRARREASRVEIRGACYSACALRLGTGNGLCVSPSARIGVHEARRATQAQSYAAGQRDNFATGFMEALLPRCASTLFAAARGFDSGALTVVSGQAILSACPQIRPCPQ